MKSAVQKLYVFVFLLILYCPIVVLIINSFNTSKYGTKFAGFTLDWYEKIFENSILIQSSFNSLTIAITSATITIIICAFSAANFLKYSYIGKNLLKSFLYITLIIPDIVLGISFLILFIFLKVKLGFLSLLISHVAFSLPFVVITILTRLSDFNLNLIEAARDLGATDFYIFIKIIIPSILPALLSAWLIAFTLSFDDVIVSYFTSGPSYTTLPLVIFSMAKIGIKPEVNAICTIILFASLILLIASQLIIRKKQ